MWLDDDFNPDSEEDRAQMMFALQEAEAGRASPSPESPTLTPASACKLAGGHTVHYGPPYLLCSVPWGLMLLREADPSHSALTHAAAAASLHALDTHKVLTISVDWRDLATASSVGGGPVRLVVRRQGVDIATALGRGPPEPLSVQFSVAGAAPGAVFIARLSWPAGQRHLHCMAPLHAPVRLMGLTAPPAATHASVPPSAPSIPCLLAADRLTNRLPLTTLPTRGVGLEMELLTLAPRPEVSGAFTKQAEVHDLLERVAASAAVSAAASAEALAEVSAHTGDA